MYFFPVIKNTHFSKAETDVRQKIAPVITPSKQTETLKMGFFEGVLKMVLYPKEIIILINTTVTINKLLTSFISSFYLPLLF